MIVRQLAEEFDVFSRWKETAHGMCFVVLGDVIIYIKNIIIIANENEFFHPLMYLNINHHYYSESKDIWVGGEDKLQNNQFEVLVRYAAWSIDMFGWAELWWQRNMINMRVKENIMNLLTDQL